MRFILFGFLGVLLAGCPLNHNDYNIFASTLVKPGVGLIHAINILNEEGYKCSTRSPYKLPKPQELIIYCHRSRSGFIYSCIQRIDLDIDENNWSVISNRPERACTGL